jgi:hypothetical protein
MNEEQSNGMKYAGEEASEHIKKALYYCGKCGRKTNIFRVDNNANTYCDTCYLERNN